MNWFINLPIRSKVILGWGISIFLLAGLAVTALLFFKEERKLAQIEEDVLEMRVGLNGQRASLVVAAMLPPGAGQEEKLVEVSNFAAQNHELMAKLEAAFEGDPELLAKFEELEEHLAAFEKTRDEEIIPLLREGKADEAQLLAVGVQADRNEKVLSVSQEINGTVHARSVSRFQLMQRIIVVIGAASVLIAVVMVVSVDRALAAPLREITVMANRIAQGDLDVDFKDGERKDEIGKLVRAFQQMSGSLGALAERARRIAEGDLTVFIKPNSESDVLGVAFAEMTGNLQGIVNEIQDAVNVLAASSSEISTSMTKLNINTSQAAAAVVETTATVDEVKQTSSLSSEKAKYVSDASQAAAEAGDAGTRAVQQTLEGMQSIRSQIAAVADSVLALNAQSQAISEIIATVDDLASQSRLLSVNAAIEAANTRGDEGKGFGVVAQEVNSLAEQSQQATLQVRTILDDIQNATNSAVMATEEGTKIAEAGVVQSREAADAIKVLAEHVSEASQAAIQIAASSQEQLVGMDQIATAMSDIKAATGTTVDGTKQAAETARQLQELGESLKSIVKRFKV